ncbi:hypothetical protein GCM10023195_80550 [Actinoallomurus liliacearum]|uniref:Uncharacterized protein n=1 Tax=Actinoallomurus liliacearum TaxID=1080073 RepID=A0ABP8U081_9ACTN
MIAVDGHSAGRSHLFVRYLTQAAGHPPPDLPAVTVVPSDPLTSHRVIATGPPEAGAVPAGPAIEDGYVAQIRVRRPRHVPERNP